MMCHLKLHSIAAVPVVVLLATSPIACSSSNTGSPSAPADSEDDDFDRRAMLASLAEQVFLPVYQRFHDQSKSLAAATSAYCEQLGTDGQDAARDAAQEAWRKAMHAWQITEAMHIGPALLNNSALRETIYSWPLVSTCAVDQAVNAMRTDSAYDIAQQSPNRRGLPGLEYLLFAPSLDHTCPSQAAPEGWADLGADDQRSARCEYAAAVASDVATQAAAIVTAWDPAQGNYVAELSNAGQDSNSFASAQAAVNTISDALFYLDSLVKDMKLAEPAGITVNSCNAVDEPCPDELESPLAQHSRENIIANLRGFQMIITGNGPGDAEAPGGAPERLGFDDFLRALEAAELATAMTDDIAAAVAAVEAIPAPMGDALSGDRSTVIAAHTAITAITDNLKSQFLTVLGLEVPDSAAGDND